MPIDFKQVAAPSFADSNTLVALAAKQQEAAMTGIQGAWTGAMDAVQNNVQGELKNRINMAGYDDLTDPVKRAALNADMLAFNEKNLGMADMNAMGTYVDSRVPITLANQTNKLAYAEAAKSADYLANVRKEETHEKNTNKLIDESVRQAMYTQEQIANHGTAETNPDYDPTYMAALTAQRDSIYSQVGGMPNGQDLLARLHYGVKNFGREETLSDQKVTRGELGNLGLDSTRNIAERGADNRDVDLAIRVANQQGAGDKDLVARNREVFKDFPGGLEADGKTPNYNIGMEKIKGDMAKVAMELGNNLAIDGTFDEFLQKNKVELEKMGGGGWFNNVSHKSILNHYKEASDKGVPYSDEDKKKIYRGIATGSIKINALPRLDTSGIGGASRVRDSLDGFVRDSDADYQAKLNYGYTNAINGTLDRYTAMSVPIDQVVAGLRLGEDKELEKYLPQHYKDAMGIISANASNDYMNGPMGGIGGGMPRKDFAANNAPQINIDVSKLTGNPNPNQQPYIGPLSNTNTATTTEDLAAVGKANNVGTASPATKPTTTSKNTNQASKPTGTTAASKPKPVSRTTDNGYVIPNNSPTITGMQGSTQYEYLPITASVAKKLGLNTNSKGDIVMPPNRKNEVAYDVYGGKWTLKDAETYKHFTGINNSGQAKDKIKKGNAFIKGTSNYRPPQIRLKTPDLKHPLAHKLSDDPKNFVPYDERNPDGSPKHISKVNKKKYGKFTYKDAYTNFSK